MKLRVANCKRREFYRRQRREEELAKMRVLATKAAGGPRYPGGGAPLDEGRTSGQDE